MHVLDLEWFAVEADIHISPALWAACRLCDRYGTPMLVMHTCKSCLACI